jgi:hypothetical protein
VELLRPVNVCIRGRVTDNRGVSEKNLGRSSDDSSQISHDSQDANVILFLKNALKRPRFGDELVTSFSACAETKRFRLSFRFADLTAT